MNISSRCDYACRAMVELAKQAHTQQPVRATHIAEQRGIPEKYLVHILIQLKRAGLVRSVRGSQGGYRLERAPGDISLGDIVKAIDGPILEPPPLEDSYGQDLDPTWRRVAKGIEEVLESITVQDILESAHQAHMYYI